MSDVKEIPIELIRLDGGTQIRDCKTMQTKIAEYAMAMGEGNQFPPLTVFWDGEAYWLADGFHRLGAYNVVMQMLKLPGLDIECEVIEGSRREAIMYACGTNAAHGMPRTVPDKQNAVRTMLTDPLVALNEDGVPWNDRQIGRICNVDHKMVGRHRADLAAELAKSQNSGTGHLGHAPDSGERKVTRGGTTYTMNTGGINQGRQQATEQSDARPEVTAEAAAETPADPKPEPVEEIGGDEPEDPADETVEQPAAPETPAKTAVVVEFRSKWDFIYDHLKEIDRAIKALPEPDEAAANFPETLSHGLTVERCLEIQHWWLEFTRYWAARNPGIQRRRHPDFFEEDRSVNAE